MTTRVFPHFSVSWLQADVKSRHVGRFQHVKYFLVWLFISILSEYSVWTTTAKGGVGGSCCHGNQSRGNRHHEASSALCVCVCVCVYGHSMCEFTLLSSDRRWGHPPLTLCQRGRERASESRERAWLKPHNAPHAAGLKSCRFISSCSRGCLWAHTHSYTQTEARKYTDVQAGKTALLWPHR